jgi:uncharacterized protein with ParB-like and HNH nuclease domain
MLSANKEKLHSFFTGSSQYKIPFFQRAYVWKLENWTELWESIIDELTELKASRESEHFIGTIIIRQSESERLGSLIYDLIDGQQRLTTICILLRALHDATVDEPFKKWLFNLLVYTDSYGNPLIRLIHSKVDREHFQEIILSNDDNTTLQSVSNKTVGAYNYFKERITKDIKPEDIRNIVSIVLEKLTVIHMALSKNDDVQQIFDTINSLGVKLTTGELLKNYLFSLDGMECKYPEYWQSVFEDDEETVLFWGNDKTSGRVIRSTIELFLYSYLVIIKMTSIKMESLFKEFKLHLKDKNTEEIRLFAKDLHDYAVLYQTLPDQEQFSEISYSEHDKRFFHIMNELEITTAFPLVLYLYKNVVDTDNRIKIFLYLESYLVRRAICKLTTKNYNNLFLSILVDFNKSKIFSPEDFKNKLLSYTDDTNRFPEDKELEIAFKSAQLINKHARAVLFCIALHYLDHEFTDKNSLSNGGLSVEHIMPKKWRNNWLLNPNYSESARDSILLTLGNLTLVKGKLNSSMRDAEWIKKKDILRKYSTLRITTDYLNSLEWDETTIEDRANTLYSEALEIWKR